MLNRITDGFQILFQRNLAPESELLLYKKFELYHLPHLQLFPNMQDFRFW